MYLRKIDGPRCVTLPDGTLMTRADLPPVETVRWVASRKAAVIRAVRYGLITRETAIEMYGLSEDEFASWRTAVEKFGVAGLKATAAKRGRHP